MLNEILKRLEENGDELLFLCKFGSHLYGTNTERSDTDYKGVFLPNKEDVLCGVKRNHYGASTGKNKERNTAEDVDMELFSLQYWFELLEKGETVATDILFANSNEKCVVFETDLWRNLTGNNDKLFDSSDAVKSPYVRYARGQAIKYGVKGDRFGVIDKVKQYLDEYFKKFTPFDDIEEKLGDIIINILFYCGNEKYCFLKTSHNNKVLILCGKEHLLSIKITEFYERIHKLWNTYGHRSKTAMEEGGVDFKACSHAIRAIRQMEEIMLTGKVVFPLKYADELLAIKNGELSWEEIQLKLENGLDNIDELAVNHKSLGKFDHKFVKHFILKTYKELDICKEFSKGEC